MKKENIVRPDFPRTSKHLTMPDEIVLAEVRNLNEERTKRETPAPPPDFFGGSPFQKESTKLLPAPAKVPDVMPISLETLLGLGIPQLEAKRFQLEKARAIVQKQSDGSSKAIPMIDEVIQVLATFTAGYRQIRGS